MKIIVCKSYDEISARAAEIVAEQIKEKPDSILGFATGSTPIGMYKKLIDMYKDGKISFSDITSFNLDEYYPISPDNEQSYRYFMNENLFSHIDIDIKRTFVPNGQAENPAAECSGYDEKIRAAGGIDLQILGVGQNGHIGFNEPSQCLNANTHLTELTESTINANSRFFDSIDEVPTHALTMGIASILKSKKIIILANGASKREAVEAMLTGTINTSFPATMLNVHSDVTLICDTEAYPGMFLGVDIGGTDIKFGVLDYNSRLVHTSKIHTPQCTDDRTIMSVIAEKCKAIAENYPVSGIGIGTPGFINKKAGTVTAANLPFDKSPIADYLKEELALPVYLENDACCAAIGEAYLGVKAKNMLMITLGTGIGGGIVIDKKIYSGKGSAGEIGHICINPKGVKCACGATGCWEAYASVTALIKRIKEASTANPDSILRKIITEDGYVDGKTLFKALDKHCPIAEEIFEEYTDYLAVGIRSIIMTFDPDTIVIGGAISKEGNLLLEPVRKKVNLETPIKISVLQGDAGAIGAALLPKLNK